MRTVSIPREQIFQGPLVLVNRAHPGDVILFKGSRSMHMEQALELFTQQTAGREDE